jgi:hypothetical protein
MDTGGVGVASADLPAALAVAADQGAATVAGVELSAPLVAPLQVAGVAISGAELTAEGGEQITIAGGAVTAAGEDLAISASSNQISTFYPCPGYPSYRPGCCACPW